MAVSQSNNKTVLITGINGYIASVLGLHLLQKGYSIRGTTRRLASTDALLKGPYAEYRDRVTIFEVPDMTVSGAFDEASKGVNGIFHTASPVDFSLTTYEQTIIPAVSGSTTILNSALKAGPQLTSLVVTSSIVAILNPTPLPPYIFTEADYASFALETAERDRSEGKSTPPNILYGASKTAADRAVWKFKEEKHPAFAISTINPAVVIGPAIVLPKEGSKLNETLRPLYDLLSGAKEIPSNIGTGSFVDVRDVARMHIWAYEHPEKSNGERYIACKGFGPMQAQADILREHYKGTELGERIPKGETGEGYEGYDSKTGTVAGEIGYLPGMVRISGEKAPKVMGFEYVDFKTSSIDAAESLKPLLSLVDV